jgi:hypothetical protein
MRTDGYTDGTKLLIDFRNFGNALCPSRRKHAACVVMKTRQSGPMFIVRVTRNSLELVFAVESRCLVHVMMNVIYVTKGRSR